MEEKITWIIGLSGSEWDTVSTYTVIGTKTQVKKHLADKCKEDAEENDFDYGDTEIEKVTEEDGVLYAGSTFYHHHNDYTATPLMEPIDLDKEEQTDEVAVEKAAPVQEGKCKYCVNGECLLRGGVADDDSCDGSSSEMEECAYV